MAKKVGKKSELLMIIKEFILTDKPPFFVSDSLSEIHLGVSFIHLVVPL